MRFLFSTLVAFAFFITGLQTEAAQAPSTPVLSQNQVAVNSTPTVKKKKRTVRRKKEKSDLWARTQAQRAKLFKNDFSDSVYPSDPILTNMPGYKTGACKVEPDTRSTAGVRTKCRW